MLPKGPGSCQAEAVRGARGPPKLVRYNVGFVYPCYRSACRILLFVSDLMTRGTIQRTPTATRPVCRPDRHRWRRHERNALDTLLYGR
jgi:hypothetical protein